MQQKRPNDSPQNGYVRVSNPVFRILVAIWRLLLPLIAVMIGWGVLASWILAQLGLSRPSLSTPERTMLVGTVLVVLFMAGAILSYNVAALIYRVSRGSPRVTVHEPQLPRPAVASRIPYQRIGLILAGGGAKGAYQAGAMRAIWEFLEERDALDRVCMVAGTSIGAWNSLFWLAGLVRPPPNDERSAQESWWRAIKPERIVDFDWYLPLTRNHFCRATPWHEAFRRLFVDYAPVRERLVELCVPRPDSRARGPTRNPTVRFYLTRSNVKRAALEFTTNSWAVADLKRRHPRTGEMRPVVEPSLYQVLDGTDPAGALRELEEAVFASMDIPPLFPFVKIKDVISQEDEWFEDGGVIDNLPMVFGTLIEGCDLLFVLPLNATFDAAVNHHSILSRLARVMEARQGVIERNSFKQAYLYNDLHKLSGGTQVSVFAIGPAEPLAIGTTDFHKPAAAGNAYRLMYEQTAKELRETFGALSPDWIRLATVGPAGERGYIEDF
jgi:predicted acylesterase/phospholipase RssA